MVAPEEYFYYLRKSFKIHHVHGYMIGKKKNRHVCIYEEHGKWVVSATLKNNPVDPKEYDLTDIWYDCEDIIARLAKSERQRKRIWLDWASPSNWAEKMDEPIKIYPLTEEECRKFMKESVKPVNKQSQHVYTERYVNGVEGQFNTIEELMQALEKGKAGSLLMKQ